MANSEEKRWEGLRKATGESMLASVRNIPQFHLSIEVKMEEFLKAKDSLNSFAPRIKISISDMLIKVIAMLLLYHRYITACLIEDRIVIGDEINIGLAVALEEGVIVPVIHEADKKGIFKISNISQKLQSKARNRKLSISEISGGCFTISNLGMYGIDEFAAIVNPLEATILAVGSIKNRPIAEGENLKIKPTCWMSLTVDHRILDGVQASVFLKALKETLENKEVLQKALDVC